jgi:HK97 family phage portal protein
MFNKIFSIDAQSEKAQLKNYDYNSGSYLCLNDALFANTSNQSEFIKYYYESSPVFTALKLIQDNVSSIKPVIKDNKKEEFIYEHPLLDLLEKPNPFISGDLFIKSFVGYFKLTGNAYLNIIGSGKPVELHVLRPTNINIQANNRDGYPQQYNYVNNDGSIIFKRDNKNKFIADNGNEIVQLMNFNPKYCNSNLYGVSDLAAVELEISQYILASIHNNSLLQNQARPSGILTYKGVANDIQQETIDAIKETLKSSLSGATNAGNATFLSGDFDWKQMSQSIKDMDFATLRQQTATAIYNALKIPLPMVSPDNMTLANMETAKVNFYDNTILPLTKTIYNFLGKALLPRYSNSENLELTFDEASIEALEPRQVDNTLKLSQSGVLTINEIRSQLGYEDLEGGDTLYQPVGLAPIASDRFTDDNRQTPSQEKAIFIKTMKEFGYSSEDIEYWANNYK